MDFGDRRWLLALAVLALIAVLRGLMAMYLRRRLRPIGGTTPAYRRSHHGGLALLRECCWWTGLVLVVVACALPQAGRGDGMRGSIGANIYVCIDCSNSMNATDAHPSRAVAAQRKIADLLNLAPNHRIGLVPFAKDPCLRCTPTGDPHVLRILAKDCGPELFPVEYQGTGIGKAVRYACRLHNNERTRGQAVLVISDGADPDATSVEAAAEEARTSGIPVYGLCIGDADREATITLKDRTIPVPPDPTTLDLLAERTGGLRVSMTNNNEDIQLLLDHITDNVGIQHWEEQERTRKAQIYQPFALAALILLALASLLPTLRGWPRRYDP